GIAIGIVHNVCLAEGDRCLIAHSVFEKERAIVGNSGSAKVCAAGAIDNVDFKSARTDFDSEGFVRRISDCDAVIDSDILDVGGKSSAGSTGGNRYRRHCRTVLAELI